MMYRPDTPDPNMRDTIDYLLDIIGPCVPAVAINFNEMISVKKQKTRRVMLSPPNRLSVNTPNFSVQEKLEKC
jgi:hypothetical protein